MRFKEVRIWRRNFQQHLLETYDPKTIEHRRITHKPLFESSQIQSDSPQQPVHSLRGATPATVEQIRGVLFQRRSESEENEAGR